MCSDQPTEFRISPVYITPHPYRLIQYLSKFILMKVILNFSFLIIILITTFSCKVEMQMNTMDKLIEEIRQAEADFALMADE